MVNTAEMFVEQCLSGSFYLHLILYFPRTNLGTFHLILIYKYNGDFYLVVYTILNQIQ